MLQALTSCSQFPFDEQLEWGYIEMLGLVGAISLTVLLGVYLSENWFSPARHPVGEPITFLQTLLEWLAYMLLYSGLTALLDGILRFI